MSGPTDDLLKLSMEARELSYYIARLKRKLNRMAEGPDKEQLREDIKMRQFQALFYIEKMDNLQRNNSK